jgi:hypothetical protein
MYYLSVLPNFEKRKQEMTFSKFLEFDIFEIKNGIIGMERDVLFQLIEVMYFRPDEIIQNVYFLF